MMLKGEGFNDPRGLADVSVQKNRFDRYYGIKAFFHLKALVKRLRKVHFCITKMARKSMKDS